MKQKAILVLHGPNLNLLGQREPDKYGIKTLNDINQRLINMAAQQNIKLVCFQSNCEGALIDKTHEALNNNYDFIIVNPAGLTHTSVAWRDAFLAVKTPFIEVHLSNIYAREPFRHSSYFSDIAMGSITGLGTKSYTLALTHAIEHILTKE